MVQRNLVIKTLLVFLVSASIPFRSAAAQENGQGNVVELTLKSAQQMAADQNRTLKNASIEVQKAYANKWASIANMLPQIKAGADYSNYCGYSMDLMGMSLSMPPYATFTVTTSLALSGAMVISTQLNDISIKMSDISLKKSEQEIRDQVKVLYFSALVSGEMVSLLEKNLDCLQRLHEMSQKSVDVGVAEQTNADQIQVQVATMTNTLSYTKRSLEMIYNSMRLQLNIDVNTDIKLTQTIDDLLEVDGSFGLVNDEFILDNNYNYQLAKQNAELSKKQVALAAWAYAPTLSAYHQYTNKKYFSDEMTMNMTPPNMIGVTLSIPIFSSGNRLKTLKAAQLAYKQQQNTLSDSEQSLVIQHRQLCYNLVSAYESYNTQKENLDVTQRVFDNIANKYEHGMSSAMDVTTSGTSLITAQSNYVQAILEYVNAQVELEKLLNK